MSSLVSFLIVVGAISARNIPQINFTLKESSQEIAHGNPSISDFNFLSSIRVSTEDWSLVTATGIILNEQWILTAAISVYKQTVKNLEVRVGSSSGSYGGQVVNVSKSFIHPGFFANVCFQNNLALLKLEEDLEFNENVQPAKLAASPPEVNTSAVVVGFGLALPILDPPLLRSINVTISDTDESKPMCAAYTNVIHTNSSSTGGPTFLDWGSPLIVGESVVGSYIGDVVLPYERTNSTMDKFADLTSLSVWDWLVDTIVQN